MPSQFFGLQIGYTGLTAYQAALNTTGNNIANVETKGYSRQVTNQQAARALRTYTSYGMAGAGTNVTSIDQIRNAYYDIKYWNSSSLLGEYNVKSDYMKQIENYFNDDGETIRGFSTLTDNFYKALEDLEINPGDVAVRTTFVGQAKAFTEYFNTLSEDLTKLQIDANTQIKDSIDQINTIASQIATLNKQINVIELQGPVANELRDQRAVLVDELSKFVDVEISEDPIYADAKNTIESGAHRYQVTISGTQTLVDGYDYRTLDCVSRPVGDKINQSDADGLYDIFWHDTGMRYYPVGPNYSGELKGLLQVRDGNNNEAFRGMLNGSVITGVTTTLDGTPADSHSRIKVDVTNEKGDPYEYLQNILKSTVNGTGTITVGGLEYKYTGWAAEFDTNGNVTSYSFDLAPDTAQKEPTAQIRDGSDVRIGVNIAYQGIPYYMEQMNEWIRNFAQVFNDVEERGEDIHGNKLAGTTADDVTAFFVANKAMPEDKYDQYNFGDQTTLQNGTRTNKVTSTSDSYYQLTASNFMINTHIVEDASLMATTEKNGNVNLSAYDIVDKLEKIRTDKSMMEFRGCSSSEFLSCILGDIALNANSANNFQSNFTNIQSVISNQRMSESGVDNDEEALNLVKYKNAYNLSAKMIQVMTEIYDKLINQTGV